MLYQGYKEHFHENEWQTTCGKNRNAEPSDTTVQCRFFLKNKIMITIITGIENTPIIISMITNFVLSNFF